VPEKSRRQNRSLDRAGKENDGIEHEFFVRLLAADPVLRITRSCEIIFPVTRPHCKSGHVAWCCVCEIGNIWKQKSGHVAVILRQRTHDAARAA
jgi:hypothetical protein